MDEFRSHWQREQARRQQAEKERMGERLIREAQHRVAQAKVNQFMRQMVDTHLGPMVVKSYLEVIQAEASQVCQQARSVMIKGQHKAAIS